MTSIAFLLGVMPLRLASGAGAAARNSLGTTVFGGALVSTVVNLVFIPGVYVLVQRFRRVKQREVATPSLAAAD
jgi:HAE1 family hydrophobic/amphiphilic exporter-1